MENLSLSDLPLVTVIAVCYNQEKWVEQSLNSVLNQSYPNIQLIIADDGSKDNSKNIIEKWIAEKYPSAIFINHQINAGLPKNINSTLSLIKGEYYQVFGCDDVMLPNKIMNQVQQFKENKDFDIVYSDMSIIDASDKKSSKTYYEKHTYKKPLSGFIYKEVIQRSFISAPSVLIRKNVLNDLKQYNEALTAEDYDFFLRASKKYKFLYTPEVTVLYRVNSTSMSNNTVPLINYKERFSLYYQNFDSSSAYKALFTNRLFFCAKNLYKLKYKNCSILFFKALIKTRKIWALKYILLSIPLLVKNNVNHK